jgi:hypothetical protein
MPPFSPKEEASDAQKGVGPLIPPLPDLLRPLRQQVFERVRAAGLIARVQVAKDLGVSPATITTLTSELIEAGLIEEVASPRDTEAARGRPAVHGCAGQGASGGGDEGFRPREYRRDRGFRRQSDCR